MRDVVDRFGGAVTLSIENWGESELARRMGLARYPVVFVDDAVVATPRDFGFYGGGESGGRYTPWREAASHERFRRDLTRTLQHVLAGEGVRSVAADAPAPLAPEFTLTDLEGRAVGAAQLRGTPAIVEFWATWCVPCRTTLPFLGELARARAGGLRVLAIAVESDEKDVRALSSQVGPGVAIAMGTPEVARAFGDLTAVPTTFVLDAEGRVTTVIHGSPPDLHDQVRRAVDALSP